MKRAAGLVLVLGFSVLWLGCAGNSSSSSSSTTPTPTLLSISPSNASPGGSDFTLTATGTDFIPPSGGQCGSEICFNHSLRSTTFVSSSQLTATIPAALIAEAGTVPVFIVSNCEVASNTLIFNIGTCTVGVIERASVASAGGQATGGSDDVEVSADGRFVVFPSSAADLVSGDTNGGDDIFVRDTCRGATGCTPSTVRVSLTDAGGQGNDDSFDPDISPDGRFVVFESIATNLVAGDTNGVSDAFLRDTCIGATGLCTPSTIRISVSTGGVEGNADSTSPNLSSTGRFVSFRSFATNLVAGDSNGGEDVFVRDTCLGAGACVPSTIRASVDTSGSEGNLDSNHSFISGTGRFVVFQSDATNLVIGDGNFISDVFLRDTCIGAGACTPSTIRVSVNTAGTEGNGFSEEAKVSDDGRFVVFGSLSTNLVAGDTNGSSDIFLRDTCIGALGCTPSTTRVSVDTAGMQGNSTSFSGVITPNGRFVGFDSEASNWVPGDTNGTFDLFVRDTCFGASGACTPSTVVVSVNSSGAVGNGLSHIPALSDNASIVAFTSLASNLVSGDTNAVEDVFVATNCF